MEEQTYSADNLGERIKAARLKAGLTQSAAATLAGLSQSNWSDYEKGKATMTAGTLCRIATAVNASPDSLLAESEATP